MRCLLTILLACLTLADTQLAQACPFCTAESRTLTEELADADVAIFAKLLKPAIEPDRQPQDGVPYGTIDPDTGAAQFVVESVLLGDNEQIGIEPQTKIEAVFFGDPDFETQYLIRGIGEPLEWAIPLELSPLAVKYVRHLQTLPESGADRLAFFQDYLEHDDALLAQDAYDEFARAPYDDVRGLKDRMDRQQLLAWIESNSVSPSRRRLFLTMLGVCGQPEDLPRIEAMLLSDSRVVVPVAEAAAKLGMAVGGPLAAALTPETVRLDGRRSKLGLDAMVACYLTLRGPAGLDLIDERFLSDDNVDYSHVYSTLMALRFLAEQDDIVPRERLLESARLLLENRDFADQIVPDLARWGDWSVLDKLVEMYHQTTTGEYEKYVREPIITYLDVAVEEGADRTDDLGERAQRALDELEPIDKDAFRRARSLRSFGFLAQADRPAAKESRDNLAKDAELDAKLEEGEVDETTLEEIELIDDTESISTETITAEAEAEDSTAIPNPATFGNAATVSETSEPDSELPADKPFVDPAPSVSPDTSPSQNTATELPTVASEEPIDPPSRTMVAGLTLLAATGLVGLLWLILRSGSA